MLELDASGRSLRTIDDANGPEGIVPIGGGMLALAEQKANRVVRLDPETGTTAPLVDVPNHTANEGVDGIAYDAARSRLLVPDSANGRLLAVPLTVDGAAAGSATVLATGLGRPVAAWPEGDGSVDVGVENAPGLIRVAATGGGVTPLVPRGTLAQVDEVLGEGGLLYITDLSLHVVVAVDPSSGRTARLVTGASDPQGLALFSDGRLVLVESASRALAVVGPCR